MNTPNQNHAPLERFFPLLGNGKMLCRFHGADLSGLRPFYDAPSLLSFRTVFSQTPTDFVRRFHDGALLYRWLFLSDTDTKACLIRDSLLENRPVYIRKVTTDIPFTVTLASPAYVKSACVSDYQLQKSRVNACLLSARAGLVLAEGITSPRTASLIVFLQGNAAFSEDGNILIEKGESAIFVIGGSREEALAHAEAALCCLLPTLTPYDAVWNDSSQTALTALPPIAYATLLAHTAENGGVIHSFDSPYLALEDLPLFIKAFLCLKEKERAKALLLFCLERFMKTKSFSPRLALSPLSQTEDAPTCSGLPVLHAACLYLKEDPDRALFDTLFPMMKSALYQSDRLLARHTLPMSPASRLLARYPQLYRHLFDGSLADTLQYLDAASTLLSLCSSLEKSLPRDTGRIANAVTDAKDALARNFSKSSEGENETPLSAPVPLAFFSPDRRNAAKLPRFTHAVCLGCLWDAPFAYEGVLERVSSAKACKDKSTAPLYLCPTCHARFEKSPQDLPPFLAFLQNADYENARITADALAVMLAALSDTGKEVFLSDNLAALLDKLSLDKLSITPSSEHDGIWDALLLSADSALARPTEKLRQTIADKTDGTALLATHYHGATPLTFTPDAAALALLAATL